MEEKKSRLLGMKKMAGLMLNREDYLFFSMEKDFCNSLIALIDFVNLILDASVV